MWRSKTIVTLLVAVGLLCGSVRHGQAQEHTLQDGAEAAVSSRPAADPKVAVTLTVGGAHLQLREGPHLGYRCSPPPHCDYVETPAVPDALVWQVYVAVSTTAHLKTELAAASNSGNGFARTDQYAHELVVTPTYTQWVDLRHHYGIVSTSLAEVYEFHVGSRLRPFLGAGVALDQQRTRDARTDTVGPARTEVERRSLIEQGVHFSEDDTLPTAFPPSATTYRLHAYARLGVRVYLGSRVSFVFERVGPRAGSVRYGLGLNVIP